MNNYCPYCREPISISKKIFMDVRSKRKCKNCSGTYGIPWYEGLLSITMIGLFIKVYDLPYSLELKLIFGAILVCLASIINIVFIPIEKK